MTFLFLSFLAGILTVLAPCVLPLLPVIVGGSLADPRGKYKALTITISLSLSVIVFTLLLKWATLFIHVPQMFWSLLSGTIIIIFGLVTLFPNAWDVVSGKFTRLISKESNTLLATGYKKKSFWGDVVMGAALGPVFSSCSPTYFIILASVLPQSFGRGLVDLIAYSIGLAFMLLLISVLGQKLIGSLSWATDSEGWFKKTLGVLFILVGVFIIAGLDKTVQTYVLNNVFDVTKLETVLLQKTEPVAPAQENAQNILDTKPSATSTTATSTTASTPKKNLLGQNPKRGLPFYKEIVNPGGYVNSGPFTIGQFIGKKVILLDVMTYSCINCQRTFPYVVGWWNKYKDQGLEVIGIHTPEFAFEHDIDNVRAGLARFGITFPVVLDNSYGTWNAYGNSYWPRKYLIDIYGNIVFDHIGEGGYDETEQHIQDALAERARVLGMNEEISTGLTNPTDAVTDIQSNSPETYFGAMRNEYLANGTPGVAGPQTFTAPSAPITPQTNTLYLAGPWNIQKEYAENTGPAKIIFKYNAKNVYFVASGKSAVTLKIFRDGVPVSTEAGADVKNGVALIKESRLYHLVGEKEAGEHTLEIDIDSAGLDAYTFTFG